MANIGLTTLTSLNFAEVTVAVNWRYFNVIYLFVQRACALEITVCYLDFDDNKCVYNAVMPVSGQTISAFLFSGTDNVSCRISLSTSTNFDETDACGAVSLRQLSYMYRVIGMPWTMDWAVDTTGLIITSVTCCWQEAQSVSDTRGGRSGTRSCWRKSSACTRRHSPIATGLPNNCPARDETITQGCRN